jgi:hypothetical protein
MLENSEVTARVSSENKTRISVMGLTVDLGRRIELVSMDPHFQNISVGLYRRQGDGKPEFLVHTYSGIEGARQRVEFIARAMAILGGMELALGEPQKLRFPCGSEHHLAARRVFLEACKLDPNNAVNPRPLTILDKKSSRNITAASLGGGVYHLTADGEEEGRANRIAAVTGGLIKLAEMRPADQSLDRVAFPCGQAHDSLVGLLLVRSLNVRAIIREQEMATSRGILTAPSAQKS